MAGTRATGQDHLPARVAGLAQLVRHAGVGEREGRGDADAERVVRDELGVLGELRPEPPAVAGEHDAQLEGSQVGDRHDPVGGAAAQLDRDLEGVLPGGVEDRVDAVRREGADPVGEAVAVGDRDRAEGAQVVVVARDAVPMTVTPRATASWTPNAPTAPAAPCTSSVSPSVTSRVSSTRSEVSRATGSAAAVSQSRPAGLRAKSVGQGVLGVGAGHGRGQHLVAHRDAGDALARPRRRRRPLPRRGSPAKDVGVMSCIQPRRIL